jgi:hypothetical protein
MAATHSESERADAAPAPKTNRRLWLHHLNVWRSPAGAAFHCAATVCGTKMPSPPRDSDGDGEGFLVIDPDSRDRTLIDRGKASIRNLAEPWLGPVGTRFFKVPTVGRVIRKTIEPVAKLLVSTKAMEQAAELHPWPRSTTGLDGAGDLANVRAARPSRTMMVIETALDIMSRVFGFRQHGGDR